MLRFDGIEKNSWLSLVAADLNSGNPCADGVVAAASPASSGSPGERLNSGPMRGGELALPGPRNGETVMLEQRSYYPAMGGSGNVPAASDQLKFGISFAICYSTGWPVNSTSNVTSELEWQDTNIRFMSSKVMYVTVRGIQHHISTTTHTLPHNAAVSLSYSGSLPTGQKFALHHGTGNNTCVGIPATKNVWKNGEMDTGLSTGKISVAWDGREGINHAHLVPYYKA